MDRRTFLGLLTAAYGRAAGLSLSNKPTSVRFAVIGDTGTGEEPQYAIGAQLAEYHKVFPFDFVMMLGDNVYGGESPKDLAGKFENPYKRLLSEQVKFYAALGNHDHPSQRRYKYFNMNGERYYTFKPQDGARFFVLDSNYMDQPQVEWLERELAGSGSEWKICVFHHPMYSSGKHHGSDVRLRKLLEPLFVKYGVNVALSGHDHIYERTKPQNGVTYFVCGNSGQLRKGDLARTDLTARGFDQDRAFMLVEISGDELSFQTVSRTGRTVDSAVLTRHVSPAKISTDIHSLGREAAVF